MSMLDGLGVLDDTVVCQLDVDDEATWSSMSR